MCIIDIQFATLGSVVFIFKDPFEQINIIANLFSWWYVEPQMDTGVDYTDGKFHSQPLKSEE